MTPLPNHWPALVAWATENLLASTFIGTGALLALLLATWPLRALWRLWRGRKVRWPRTIQIRSPEQQAEYDHLTEGIAAAQKRHIINLRGGYTYSAADDLRAIRELMALRDKLPKASFAPAKEMGYTPTHRDYKLMAIYKAHLATLNNMLEGIIDEISSGPACQGQEA